MRKKGPRQTVFVCSAIKDNSLVSQIVEADTQDAACRAFEEKASVKAEAVLGPFFKKKTGVLDTETTIQFSGETKKAIYNDWYVKAMLLSSPEGFAYVFYDKRIDDKKVQKPAPGLVKIDELKDYNEERTYRKN